MTTGGIERGGESDDVTTTGEDDCTEVADKAMTCEGTLEKLGIGMGFEGGTENTGFMLGGATGIMEGGM